MEKNIILSQSKTDNVKSPLNLIETVCKPFEKLRKYYSDVLEEEVSYGRMWRLINAQLAFVAAVFPVEAPLTARIVCTVWLICALLKCRR